MIVLLKMQTAGGFVKFLSVQYFFPMSPVAMKEQGEHEGKMCEVNFYRGEKSGETFNRRDNF